MLILHTAPRYAPEIGGVEEVVKQLSTRLARRGHEVHVATSFGISNRRHEIIDGVQVHRFDVKTEVSFGASGEVDEYRRFVRSKAWDVIAMHFLPSWSTTALLPNLKELESRKVLVGHGVRAFHFPSYRNKIAAITQYLKHFDRIVALSNLLEETLLCEQLGLPMPKVIPNGVDLNEWNRPIRHLRSKKGIGNRPWLLLVSNHSPGKSHSTFFHVVHRVRRKIPDAVGMIIGGHYPAAKWGMGRIGVQGGCWYRCRLAASLTSDVLVQWDVPREDVVSAIKEADVMMLTSEYEASPLVMIESMAASTPWLSLDVGCIREHIGGVVANNSVEMAEAAVELIKNPERRKLLGAQGIQRARERHSWESIVNQYEALYHRLIEE
jgi:glycosyltransferase involved in cell wall biosynthesis